MHWFGEYLFETKHSGHSTLNQVTNKSYLWAVPKYRFYTRIVMSTLCSASSRKAEEF